MKKEKSYHRLEVTCEPNDPNISYLCQDPNRLGHAPGAVASCMLNAILLPVKRAFLSASRLGQQLPHGDKPDKPLNTPIRRELDLQVYKEGSKAMGNLGMCT